MDETSAFKYDVAFSFLAADEPLARQLNDLLTDRYSTFLYSEQQKAIAGTDGEVAFKNVFAVESRFVVVLYREGWGKTPWTRMEEDAIRGRAYDHGYDFVKLVPLDKPATVPPYFPRTQLWINADRWGVQGTVAVIEARLQELGANTRPETSLEHAQRLRRRLDFEARHKSYVHDGRGVTDSQQAFQALTEAVRLKVDAIKVTSGLSITMKQDGESIVLLGHSALRIHWRPQFRNSLHEAKMSVERWRGHPPMHGAAPFEQPVRLSQEQLTFELTESGVGKWISERRHAEYEPEALAELALNIFLKASPE